MSVVSDRMASERTVALTCTTDPRCVLERLSLMASRKAQRADRPRPAAPTLLSIDLLRAQQDLYAAAYPATGQPREHWPDWSTIVPHAGVSVLTCATLHAVHHHDWRAS